MPSDAQIRAEMAKQQRSAASTLSGPIVQVKPGTFKAVVPNINAPKPVRTQSLDEIVSQYNAARQGRKVNKPGSDLMIFVSFSMPRDKLIELARQAKKTGAVMIVRGFKDNSLRATKAAALDINRSAHAAWEINPGLFRAFKVQSVPAFVIATSQAESVLDDGCAPQATYSSVSGDISVEIALDELRMHAQPSIAKYAEKRLDDLRARNAPVSITQ